MKLRIKINEQERKLQHARSHLRQLKVIEVVSAEEMKEVVQLKLNESHNVMVPVRMRPTDYYKIRKLVDCNTITLVKGNRR